MLVDETLKFTTAKTASKIVGHSVLALPVGWLCMKQATHFKSAARGTVH